MEFLILLGGLCNDAASLRHGVAVWVFSSVGQAGNLKSITPALRQPTGFARAQRNVGLAINQNEPAVSRRRT